MPKKSLGQHFLKNKSAIQKMIASLELKPGETVIEIGPGKGALTIPLVEECRKIGCKLIAIEKDRALALSVKRLGYSENLEVLTGDALKILPEISKRYSPAGDLTAKRFKVVGNIPYYITGKLLRVLSELENRPTLTILMIQKEVAERICAHPPKTSPTHRKCSMCGMNLLAAATQFWSEPKILMNLKSADFDPAPEVDSAIIKLETRKQKLEARMEDYYKLIKIVFKQPRKTLLNNLSEGLGKNNPRRWRGKAEIAEILEQIGLKPDIRPQDLDIATLSKLALRTL